MIRILTEEVESDYLRTHVQIGMGFSVRALCKAERQAKQLAEELDLVEAEERVRVVSEQMASFFFLLPSLPLSLFPLIFSV